MGWGPRRVTVLMVGVGLLALLPVVVEHRDGSPRRKVGLGGVGVRLLDMCCPWAEQILEYLPGYYHLGNQLPLLVSQYNPVLL